MKTTMQAEYSIVNEPGSGMMRIRISGFFEQADVDRFDAARRAALRALGTGPGEHLTLVDIRDMDIQSQDSVLAFRRVLADPFTASRRIAFVVPRSLLSMQVRRAASERTAEFFLDAGPAEAWLDATPPLDRKLRSAG